MQRVTRSLSPTGGETPATPEEKTAAAESFEPGAIVADKLRIVRCLGAGGMGVVYEVEHILTKHNRALKVLHARYATKTDTVERFLREASAAGRIGNPHIVDTFDAGVFPSGAPFIVMELLGGRSLHELLRERGKLSIPETIALVRHACAGAEAAHRAGIVHRDLKPENLFVVTRDGQPFVKLLDFGISKFDPELSGELALTSEGSQLGTPFYMAPEQLKGSTDIGPEVDVYALGVILYECVAGKRPFDARSLSELSIRIHQGEYVPLEHEVPDAPPAFVALVRRAMHHDPKQRLPSARVLGDELGKLKEAEALADTIYSPTEAPQARRRRGVFVALALGAIVVASMGYGLHRSQNAAVEPVSSAPPLSTASVQPSELPASRKPEPSATQSSASDPVAPAQTAKPRGSVERRSVDKKLDTENPY
jgi:serine/threonine protein kinase